MEDNSTPLYPKRKLYITSGEYEEFILDKKTRKGYCHDEIKINISSLEEELFRLLMNYTHYCKLKTTIRIAGGWVRDKVLEFMNSNLKDSISCEFAKAPMIKKDIDIALNDISGKEFALGFNDWLQTYHNYETHTVGIINRDPEKSKHLETATLVWREICIDFVGLRSEEYTLESRIPTISIGTAEEDSFRRDFTINSMFFNVNERKIEDLTGMGISDLCNKIIRTPLDPIKTLLDDPLRALRAFRFTSRLHFRVEENLLNACRNKALHDALQTKISRERVGSEIHEMISNRYSGNPAIGLRLIVETNLTDSVFKVPEKVIYSYICDLEFRNFLELGNWYFQGPYLVELTHRTIELLVSNVPKLHLTNVFGEELLEMIRRFLNYDQDSNWGVSTYFSFLLPLYHHYFINEKKEIPLVKYILSNSLKLSNKITNSVMKLFDSLLKIVNRIINMNSLTILANLTLRGNDEKDLYEVEVCSQNFSKSSGQNIPEILDSYFNHFKSQLENEGFIRKFAFTSKGIEDKNSKNSVNPQRRVELGIFVLCTGSLWLEMLIALFSLDLIYSRLVHILTWN
ncbi:tRNA nucleotidyltransferase [Cryptosporidium felis]|nr:tRNA nucleotidyltransferase [Cryptosporidium felis]